MHVDIAVALSVISLIVAALSAQGALSQASKVSTSHEASTFLRFGDRYNSDEMHRAFRLLSRAYWQSDGDIGKFFSTLEQSNPRIWNELDRARRLVSRFYYDIARLYMGRLISKRLARTLLSNNGVNLLYQVCEPMNDERDPQRLKTYIAILHGLLPKYNEGEIFHHEGDDKSGWHDQVGMPNASDFTGTGRNLTQEGK